MIAGKESNITIINPINNYTQYSLELILNLIRFNDHKKMVYNAARCSLDKKPYDAAEATTEDAPISQVQDSLYFISKVMGEFYAVYFHKQHNLPSVRAISQNVYGPGEILGAGSWRGTIHTVWRNVIPNFIYKSLKGEILPLYHWGDVSKDFINGENICEGLMACALKGRLGEAYNITIGNEVSIKDWAELICEYTGKSGGFDILPKREWDTMGKRFGSTEKAEQELGFKAKMPLNEGLKKTVKWTRENLSLIELSIKKHEQSL